MSTFLFHLCLATVTVLGCKYIYTLYHLYIVLVTLGNYCGKIQDTAKLGTWDTMVAQRYVVSRLCKVICCHCSLVGPGLYLCEHGQMLPTLWMCNSCDFYSRQNGHSVEKLMFVWCFAEWVCGNVQFVFHFDAVSVVGTVERRKGMAYVT